MIEREEVVAPRCSTLKNHSPGVSVKIHIAISAPHPCSTEKQPDGDGGGHRRPAPCGAHTRTPRKTGGEKS